MVSGSLGLPHCGMNLCSHKSSLVRRQSLNRAQQDLPFFWLYVHLCAWVSHLYFSSFSFLNKWSAKTSGTLEMAKWSCKKDIEPFYKTMNILRSEGDCPGAYRKYMPVLENRSSKFKSSIQKLKKQGVRLGSCH